VIIFRYFCREVLSTTFAVCVVLLLILISGRLVKYLAEVAASAMEPSVMLAALGYRIPGFLELTLPLAFFLGLLLSLGRLRVDNEISVLHACGVSEGKLLGYTLVIAGFLAIFVGYLSLVLSPAGMQRASVLAAAQSARGEMDDLVQKTFYPLRDQRGVIYAGDISSQRGLNDVFLVLPSQSGEGTRAIVVVAKTATQQRNEGGFDHYLSLKDGTRYEITPGRYDYQRTNFSEYGIRLAKKRRYKEDNETALIATRDLFDSQDPKQRIALQWRLSIPMMMFVVAFLAWPLSRTRPRQGRYARLLPAVLLYLTYLLGLNALRGSIESGSVPASVTLLPMHVIFLALAAILIVRGAGVRRNRIWRWWSTRPS
tara:strand:- start:743 stop:1852 length:1110 start_codon:yes stop_codon:yes gene_type:complete